jgi:hypothetical protein
MHRSMESCSSRLRTCVCGHSPPPTASGLGCHVSLPKAQLPLVWNEDGCGTGSVL